MNCDCDNEMNVSFVVAVHWTRATDRRFCVSSIFRFANEQPLELRTDVFSLSLSFVLRLLFSVFASLMRCTTRASVRCIRFGLIEREIEFVLFHAHACCHSRRVQWLEWIYVCISIELKQWSCVCVQYFEIIILLNLVASPTIWNLSEMQSIKGKLKLTFRKLICTMRLMDGTCLPVRSANAHLFDQMINSMFFVCLFFRWI